MAGPNSTLYDIATSIEETHGRLTNLVDVALDQAGSTSPKHVDRVLTLLQVMKGSIESLAAARDAAYAIARAEKAPAGSFKEGGCAMSAAACDAEKAVDVAGRLGDLGNQIMYRLYEVDSVVKGCDALLEAARDAGEEVLSSQNITTLSYLLTMASEKLMEHWRFVDAEMAGLRNDLGRAREVCTKS